MKVVYKIVFTCILFFFYLQITDLKKNEIIISQNLTKGWNIIYQFETNPNSTLYAFSNNKDKIRNIEIIDKTYYNKKKQIIDSIGYNHLRVGFLLFINKDCSIKYKIKNDISHLTKCTNKNNASKQYAKNDENIIYTRNYINKLNEQIKIINNTNKVEEIFSEQDAPIQIGFKYNSDFFDFSTPWGYLKENNKNRNYPIVIIGKHNESRFFTDEIKKKYPAFYLIYNKSTEESGNTLRDIIKKIIIEEKGYRIDISRLYLTGWSEGGSGGYKILEGFYSDEMCIAAMIRIAGQSQTELSNEIVKKTSIWYHTGIKDKKIRTKVAKQSYDFIKNHPYNEFAFETIIHDTLFVLIDNKTKKFPRLTKIIKNNNIEVFKLSIYENMGHIVEPPYFDNTIFDWLFSQSTKMR